LQAPVAWVDEKPLIRRSGERLVEVRGTGYWAVTRHAAIAEVSKQRSLFSSAARGAFLPDPKSAGELAQNRRLLIHMDPPDHGRIRQTVASAFKPKIVRAWREVILSEARALLDAVRGREFDAVTELCAELPLRAICTFVGMPRQDRALLLQWSNALVGFDDPDFSAAQIDAYKRAFVDAQAYARSLIADKRRTPADDLASELVHGALADGTISQAEFCSLFQLLVIAGNETTRHLLSGALLALHEDAGQRRALIADPALLPTAVEELMRYVSPVMQMRRTAVHDTELEGTPIAAGDKVVMYYISGNYDEDVFAQPHRLDLARRPNPHLGFGIGPHFCLGAALARIEAAALLEALGPDLDRFEPTAAPERLQSNFVNGLKSMPARIRRAGHG
ncbi:MAG: cytochrome P450, partial [Solirubrobacteraceae bacterium]